MAFYISTESVTKAYECLSEIKISNNSLLHHFFILKASGFSRDTFTSVENLKDKSAFEAAFCISSLFSSNEFIPEKYNFISPFGMSDWGQQSISEPLKKWVGSRMKNNIIGGATTWRKLVEIAPNNTEIKFKFNYIDEFKKQTLIDKKINLFALSIWAYRFQKFESKISLVELKNLFLEKFKITKAEEDKFFKMDNSYVSLNFDEDIHNTSFLREKIGRPPKADETWIESRKTDNKIDLIMNQDIVPGNNTMDILEKIRYFLDKDKQVILAGPPGTSKSYYSNLISETDFKEDHIKKIQFHPKYTYSDFIGGFIVDGDNVKYSDGILYELAKEASTNPEEDYLLIIDEINRANVGSVFGETIQVLDRNYKVSIYRNRALESFYLPNNLKIIATMNSADRSIGSLDFAIKRRFPYIYCPPNYDILSEKCKHTSNFSISDFLKTLNKRILKVLKNKELTIGHSFFMLGDSNDGVYTWSDLDFENLFKYKILPLIEDFSRNNENSLKEILGDELYAMPKGEKFTQIAEEYYLNEN